MAVYGIIFEAGNSNIIKFGLSNKVYLNKDNKTFTITNINFNKFLLRLKEMYNYNRITNLFDAKYSLISLFLYKKNIITKDKLRITNLEVHLFFALELYKIFLDMSEFYNLKYYKTVADQIYYKTWVSKYDTVEDTYTNLTNLKNFNYTLKDYQLEFVREYTNMKNKYELEGQILSFEQGLGKTFTSIALAECLNKKQVVIVCPNSLRDVWAYEIKNYYKIYDNESLWKKDIYVHNNGELNKSKNPRFIIVNQESIEKIYNIIDKSKDSMIIVDECHNFRNYNSNRTNKLFKLKEILNCKDNLMMSGTPIKATPEEIVPVLMMIDPYFTDELAKVYIKAFSNASEEISRVVKERFNRVLYRRTKNQVLELPDKYIDSLRLSIKNADRYIVKNIRKEIKEEFEIEYAKKLKVMSKIKKEFEIMVVKYSSASYIDTMNYLKYINSSADPDKDKLDVGEYKQEYFNSFLKEFVYPNIDNKEDRDRLKYLTSQYVYAMQSATGLAIGKILPPAKTNCYIEIFHHNIDLFIDMINNNIKKTIIFTPFLQVANDTYETLLSHGIGCVKIVGETKERMKYINMFKENDNVDVLVATTQTLSTGVTLTEANQMFFLGTPYRNADFEQACDRIHRIGQTTQVNIYTVLLDTGEKKNITERIDEIMQWSARISDSMLN